MNKRSLVLGTGLAIFLLTTVVVLNIPQAYADTFGNTSTAGMSTWNNGNTQISFARFNAPSSGTLSSISLIVPNPSGSGNVGIYADASGAPGGLLSQGTPQSLSTLTTFTISGSVSIVSSTNYWLAFEIQSTDYYYVNGGSGLRGWAPATCCTLPSTITPAGTIAGSYAIYATYSAGADFTITASTPSQTVGAGSIASYTLNLAASGGYTGTVTLSVTSGCPSGVTCTFTPNPVSSFPSTATLSVPTLITTPGGTTTVTVTATDGIKTHTAQVSLTVVGPTSFGFNVKSSATQIVVTLMYSWTGSGAPPQGTVTIAGPSGTPTLMESGAVVYDRTSISVSGGGNTYNLIHRVTFTTTAPGSAQVWTAYVSLAGVTSYTLAIEVS